MRFILDNVFWLAVGADSLLLLILAAMALAAEPGPKAGFPWDVFLTIFLLPVVLLTTAIVMHMLATSTLIRSAALILAASPWIVVAAGRVRDGLDGARYEDAQGRMRYFKAGPMREMADAVVRADTGAVEALANSVDLNQRGYTGMTLVTLALIDFAQARRRMGVLRVLLAAGANPNSGSQYRLPLELACRVGAEPVRLLLDAGADPNQETPDGKPAFFEAIGLPIDRTIFPMMLKHGANLHVVDRKGRRALDIARINGDEDAVRLIEARTGVN